MSKLVSFRLKIVFFVVSCMIVVVILRGAQLMLLPSEKLESVLKKTI